MTKQDVAYRGRIKYTPEQARKYQYHKPGKHRAEMRMIDRAFAQIPKTYRVLDAPCGTGRVTVHLMESGYQVTAADLSEAMIQLARENVAEHKLSCPIEHQDVEKLTYRDGSFDTIVCFRLFHHFPNAEIRRRVVNELCRVARQYVVLSYFSPLSYTSLKRKVRAATGGRKSEKHPTPRSEVEGYFREAGFRLVKDIARVPLLHTLHLAIFERAADGTTANPQNEPYRRTYDARQSLQYQDRKAAKHAAEIRLIDRAFALIPQTHRVLDVPCGGGRVMLHLANHGYTVAGADVSDGMIQIAREAVTRAGLSATVESQDIEKLTYSDKSFDTIICFRLFHHFPGVDIRRRAIAELCRVAAHNVVLSYFSAASMTSIKQKVAAGWLGGRKHPRYPVSLAEVNGYFEAAGFRFVKDFAQTPFIHTLHLAVFERTGGRAR